MASYRKIIEGLQVLASVEPKGLDEHNVQAEHDELFAGQLCNELPDEVNAKMEALGWHRSDADCWAVFT